jgi:hypothetical protein
MLIQSDRWIGEQSRERFRIWCNRKRFAPENFNHRSFVTVTAPDEPWRVSSTDGASKYQYQQDIVLPKL